MSIAQSEELKRELTDQYVVVQDGIPELRRFSGLTGQVKTVNMNGRALVQFDGPVDISWYDIDPRFLRVVSAPQPKAAPKHAEKPAAAPAAVKAASPAAAEGAKKLSPLELARQQGAGGTAPAKKLSPLEQARQQGAVGKAASPSPAPATAESVPTTPPVPVPPAVTAPALAKPASIAEMLALARQQGSAKN